MRGKVVFLALILCLALTPCLAFQAEEGEAAVLQAGDPAPPLTVDTVLAGPGEKLEWEALRGQVVVLEFWATWCGPCVPAMEHLNELAEEFAGRPVTFVSITDEEEGRIRAFMKKQPIKGWVTLDPDRSSFGAY